MVCFVLATILLGTGMSMNDPQRYGMGWTDGDCYIVRTTCIWVLKTSNWLLSGIVFNVHYCMRT